MLLITFSASREEWKGFSKIPSISVSPKRRHYTCKSSSSIVNAKFSMEQMVPPKACLIQQAQGKMKSSANSLCSVNRDNETINWLKHHNCGFANAIYVPHSQQWCVCTLIKMATISSVSSPQRCKKVRQHSQSKQMEIPYRRIWQYIKKRWRSRLSIDIKAPQPQASFYGSCAG